MKPIKLLLASILFSMVLTGCANIGNQKSIKSPHILSSSINDVSNIPSNLTDLNTEDLLRKITEVGPNRESGSKQNAVAGKVIETYFKNLKLEPYKDNSYFHKFTAKDFTNYESEYTGIPYSSLDGPLENVVGKIKGADNTKAIIITAHFDSVPDTTGVIDNTSGTTAMLRIAKQLTDRLNGKTFPVDIVFAAVNGEEQGLFGSRELYKQLENEYTNLYNINLDCVGAKDMPLSLKNTHEKSNELYKDMITYLEKYNIDRDLNIDYNDQGSSDHQSFRDGGKAAIAIGEYLRYDIIHTPRDTNLNLIDYVELDNLINAVSDFIIDGNGKMY